MELPHNYVALLIGQKQVTNLLLEVVKQQGSADFDKTLLVKDHIGSTTSSTLGYLFYELSFASMDSVKLILDNPLDLLHDSLFFVLQANQFKDGIYALLSKIYKS